MLLLLLSLLLLLLIRKIMLLRVVVCAVCSPDWIYLLTPQDMSRQPTGSLP